jgi:hypothetical protein
VEIISFENDDYEILKRGYRLIILLKSGLFLPFSYIYPTFEIAKSFAEKLKSGEVPLKYKSDKGKKTIKPEEIVEVQIYEELVIRQSISLDDLGKKKPKLGFSLPHNRR